MRKVKLTFDGVALEPDTVKFIIIVDEPNTPSSDTISKTELKALFSRKTPSGESTFALSKDEIEREIRERRSHNMASTASEVFNWLFPHPALPTTWRLPSPIKDEYLVELKKARQDFDLLP